ncbi:MAG: hypothetical protein V4506_15900 [Bacteroidota bacterium]
MKNIRINIRLSLEITFVILIPFLVLSPVIKYLSPNETAYKCWFFTLMILRAIIILRFIKLIVKWFHGKYIATKQADKKTNRALFGTSLLVLFLMLEIVFMFIPQNQDVYKLGLATKVWNAYYKENENEKSFRDKPLKGRLNTQKRVVFFLGDSFTYGNGIKKDEDRFADQVTAKMDSSKYETFNLGKGNTDTKDEFVRLVNFGLKPNYLILQYYHNDIEEVGAKYGHFNLTKTGYKSSKTSFFKKALLAIAMLPFRASFFMNYIALNNSKFLIPKSQNNYKECLTQAYSDSTCVNEHLKDMGSVIKYCSVHHIKLYVVFIPDARDIDYTQGLFNSYIIPFLKQHHTPYITLDRQFKKYKTSELVINPLNAHTNAFANALIAQQILDSIPELQH